MNFVTHNSVHLICEAALGLAWYGFWSIAACCFTTLGVTWMKTRGRS